MGLNYRKDEHLEFLSTLENEELDILVKILTKARTNNLEFEERYKKYYPNHKEYWDLIAAYYQHFGGNVIANMIRRRGVLYKDILQEVCDKMKINYSKNASVNEIEENLLQKVIEDMIEKMSIEEKKEFLEELGVKLNDFSKASITMAIQSALKQDRFLAYQLAVIVVNTHPLIGIGTILSTQNLVRGIPYPILPELNFNLIQNAWFLINSFSPAYVVTIPATIYIAILRQSKLK